jgi:hypothetical protein
MLSILPKLLGNKRLAANRCGRASATEGSGMKIACFGNRLSPSPELASDFVKRRVDVSPVRPDHARPPSRPEWSGSPALPTARQGRRRRRWWYPGWPSSSGPCPSRARRGRGPPVVEPLAHRLHLGGHGLAARVEQREAEGGGQEGAASGGVGRHSMTWSARPSSDWGIVSLSALAVLRLMTNSNFVGCSTGRSAGLAPLRILST